MNDHTARGVLGVGAGGHARVVMDAIRSSGRFKIIGLIDQYGLTQGQFLDGVEILGGETRLQEFLSLGFRLAFNGVGGITENAHHAAVFERLSRSGFEFVTVVHSAAVVSSYATIGTGTVILAGAVVNAGACVGRNVIINSGAIVEHDCQLDDHVHIAPGAVVSGGVRIGQRALIGAGAIVRQALTIGELAIVGAGSVVVKDVTAGMCVVGVPAVPFYQYVSY